MLLMDPRRSSSITNLTVFDDSPGIPRPLPSIADDAIHVAAYFGDTNGDQAYDTPDVTLDQRVIGLVNTGFAPYRLIDPVLLGDITQNGVIQANDTTSIQRAIGLVSVPDIPPLPTGLMPPPAGGPDPTIFISNVSGNPGDTVTVPVEMTVTVGTGITVSGFQVAIAYDPTKLTVNSASLGAMFPGALGFAPELTFPSPGRVIFNAASGTGTGTIPTGTTTTLFTLSFTVSADAAAGPTVINLLQSISSTTTAIFANDAKLSRLSVSPAPSNASNDSIDGIFEIAAPAPSGDANGTGASGPSGSQSAPPQSNVSVTGASVRWGSQSAPLQTAADGLRLLPAGRNRDLPWFNINQIVLTLSGPANVSPGDVTVMGIKGGIHGPVTISGSGTSTIVITLAKGITSADRVTVTIANSQIASYTRRLDILPGDVNDDGMVNRTDRNLILKHETPAHAYRASFDLNGDHTVNSGDMKLDRARVGTKLPGLRTPAETRGRKAAAASRAPGRRASAIAGAFRNAELGDDSGPGPVCRLGVAAIVRIC